MTYHNKIKWAFIAGIIGAICWIIGDVYVAGFEVDPKDYPLFSETYADQVDVGLATLMLEGSTNRLMFGALIAAMTATLFLPCVWLVYQYFKEKEKWYTLGIYYLLIISVMLMPLGHAVFYFTGEIYKAIYNTDPIAHPYLLETAAGFQKAMYITWGTAIIIMLLAYLIFSILVFMGKTTLPRWAGFISPFFLTLYQLPFKMILPSSDLKGWLGAAAFNISYLIFLLLLWFFFRNRLVKDTSIKDTV
ncbi:hypothetical protein ORI89_10315 [Sphingobacterium sp. UT-1RO-CII-1]|uniref:DUF6796 family protein n=1 Tax=Sphingobacterium sp. UT-1RO-CII-1 TaxID=2995225 RepID=UPI00227BCC8E|nr:DUF6796 family protein [Sphingobacterium sp. UT-1RO-CII-1]MCY4780045.1 hypothetical protein [Sphingobacterium sp. UT-1RO-CII-1]